MEVEAAEEETMDEVLAKHLVENKIFLIVHINMLLPGNQMGISPVILWLRLPIQFVFIYWAYTKLK